MNLRPIRTVGLGSTELALKWDKLYQDAHATLVKRAADLGIPEPDRQPIQDMVVVYRIPNEYRGTIEIPDEFKGRHDSPYSIGVFMFAGPEAMDVLESHGVLPGDYVTFARFAGEEETTARIKDAVRGARSELEAGAIIRDTRAAEEAKKKLLKLQVPFIHESVDLYDRLNGPRPTMELVRSVDKAGNATHLIQPV